MSFSVKNSKRKRILILSSTPNNLNPLQVELETKEIRKALSYTSNLDKFELIQEHAVTVNDLTQLIDEFRPNIVHFSGHGDSVGIYLENENRQYQLVETGALSRLFNYYSDVIECVILNSCYSENQARSIAQSIQYVIGTISEILDDNAIEFSKAFYGGILATNSYEEAFELGIIKVSLSNKSIKNNIILYYNGDEVKYITKQKSRVSDSELSKPKKNYNNQPKKWVLLAGASFLLLSIVFFMILVLLIVLLGKPIPHDTKFLIVIITSLSASAGSAFLGGYAKAKGKLSLPFLDTPLSFGVVGGVAVFFLTLLLGDFLYSGKVTKNDIVVIEGFYKYIEDYRDKYEKIHNQLDKEIISDNAVEIKKMDNIQYEKFIIENSINVKNRDSDIEGVANFYERVLKCEKFNKNICKKDLVKINFNEHIRNFWYAYRPYVEYKRKRGYSTMAKLVEARATELYSKQQEGKKYE